MGMWQLVQERTNEKPKVLVQAKDWSVARKGLDAVMAARFKAGREQRVVAEHLRLTRYRLTTLDEGTEYHWLSLDESEQLAIVFDPDSHSEFRASRRGVRQVAASVVEVDAAGRTLGSAEQAVQRSGEERSVTAPDDFMGEPASISVLDQPD